LRTIIIAAAWVMAFATPAVADDAATDYVFTCKSFVDRDGNTYQASKSFVIGFLEGYFVEDVLESKLSDEDIGHLAFQVYKVCAADKDLQLVDAVTKVAFALKKKK
jgi:hypothetical protein